MPHVRNKTSHLRHVQTETWIETFREQFNTRWIYYSCHTGCEVAAQLRRWIFCQPFVSEHSYCCQDKLSSTSTMCYTRIQIQQIKGLWGSLYSAGGWRHVTLISYSSYIMVAYAKLAVNAMDVWSDLDKALDEWLSSFLWKLLSAAWSQTCQTFLRCKT